MSEKVSSDWIEWAGGECPVAVGTVIQYRTRAGFESGVFDVPEWHARSTVWAHDVYPDPGTDITAYRVVQP